MNDIEDAVALVQKYPNAVLGFQHRVLSEAYAASPYKSLRPLEWVDCSSADYPTRLVSVMNGTNAYVWQQGEKFWLSFSMRFCPAPGGRPISRDSIEHGKQLAWERHQQQVASLFEEPPSVMGKPMQPAEKQESGDQWSSECQGDTQASIIKDQRKGNP